MGTVNILNSTLGITFGESKKKKKYIFTKTMEETFLGGNKILRDLTVQFNFSPFKECKKNVIFLNQKTCFRIKKL